MPPLANLESRRRIADFKKLFFQFLSKKSRQIFADRQKDGMKCSFLLVALVTVLALDSSTAQAPPPAPLKIRFTGSESVADVLGLIPAGTTVELHLRSGEKMAGVIVPMSPEARTIGTLVRLTKLTGAEYYDGLINVADVSAVVLRGLPPFKMP